MAAFNTSTDILLLTSQVSSIFFEEAVMQTF
jgi:hypothetical protein